MSDTELNPYLFFDRNCQEAMEFYQGIFGGELKLTTYAESPDTNPADKDLIIHAELSGGLVKLFGSDATKEAHEGNKLSFSLSGTDELELTKVFGSLSAGGQIKMPLQKEFWGDTFGQLTDKYGVAWMINIAAPKTA